MKSSITISAALTALALSGAAQAHDYTAGSISVGHPMAFETPPTAQTAGGYMTITNSGDTPDRLLEIRADFPKVEVHTTEMANGVARMMHAESIEIPAGETVTFKSGGAHVMFMGLNGDPFEEGEKIPATLVFEHAGTIDVTFNVEARGAGNAEMNHSNH